MTNRKIRDIFARAAEGQGASVDEALYLDARCTTDELCDMADEVRRCHFPDGHIDTCSIANARSGRCSEDCKWCAQSRFHHTGIEEYDIIDRDEALEMAAAHAAQGVRRFSLVTSGRRVAPEQIERFCKLFKEIKERTPISLCASMGLVDADGMKRLREAGVTRYHCNLETGSSYFGTLCTTHTHADKLRTIAAAREAGLEVCSGGIIGMGETPVQRLQLAREVRDAGAVSIPVNILNPIPGTPLENTPLISDDEVIRTCALFRFIAPRVTIRFAGGRRRLPEASVERMLRGGVNGAMMGDLLTTAGNGCEADKSLFRRAGYEM